MAFLGSDVHSQINQWPVAWVIGENVVVLTVTTWLGKEKGMFWRIKRFLGGRRDDRLNIILYSVYIKFVSCLKAFFFLSTTLFSCYILLYLLIVENVQILAIQKIAFHTA